MSMKNSSDTIGNRNRYHSACSAVPQRTAPPRASLMIRSEVLFSGAPSPISKLSICKDDHCPLPSADVKNEWKFPFTPYYMFCA